MKIVSGSLRIVINNNWGKYNKSLSHILNWYMTLCHWLLWIVLYFKSKMQCYNGDSNILSLWVLTFLNKELSTIHG